MVRSFEIVVAVSLVSFLSCRREADAIAQDAVALKTAAPPSDWPQWGGTNRKHGDAAFFRGGSCI